MLKISICDLRNIFYTPNMAYKCIYKCSTFIYFLCVMLQKVLIFGKSPKLSRHLLHKNNAVVFTVVYTDAAFFHAFLLATFLTVLYIVCIHIHVYILLFIIFCKKEKSTSSSVSQQEFSSSSKNRDYSNKAEFSLKTEYFTLYALC